MSLHPMILSPRRILAATALLLYSVGPCGSALEAQTVGRKEMREARTAVREGRLNEAQELYERVLGSAPNDKQRIESLYNTLLIVLSAGTDAGAPEVVRDRFEILGRVTESGEHDMKLEIKTLSALVDSIHRLRTSVEELEERRVSEMAAAELASEEERRAAAEALDAQKALVSSERSERLLLEQRLELTERHLATREEELRAKVDELGRCREERQLVLDQLEGTHASEVQMLQVVMRKNEELAKARLALERREVKLAEQGRELAAKEDEIRKREEAIREVTERVLGKEPPDS
ncbi:MAG: hypothetical protein GY769_12400 [bacterium]|nr:hypothetical protein [bacterium]